MTSPEPVEEPTEQVASAPPAPPLPWLLGYRVLGLRLPDEYHAWVARDVAAKSFLTWRIGRTFLWFLALIGLTYIGVSAVHEPPGKTRIIQALLVSLAVSLLSSGTTLVRRTLRWQRIDRRGRPVRPKGLAVLGNPEAAVLGVAVLVAFTSAAALFGYTLRPAGIAGAPCRPPDAETVDRLRSGFKDKDAKIERAVSVTYRDQQVVFTTVRVPGQPQPKPGIFLIERDGQVFEIPTQTEGQEGLTTFKAPPAIDRGINEFFIRIASCEGRRRS